MKSSKEKLADILKIRREAGLLRTLQIIEDKIDFCSNDYLGLARDKDLSQLISHDFETFQNSNQNLPINGATGSRLISGNSHLIEQFEKECAEFHQAEAALLFGSGFDANLGIISCIPQEGDVIFCDKLIHASLIDGLKLNKIEKRIFKHNNLADLQHLLEQYPMETPKWIIVESIYSMDGDEAPLHELISLKSKYNAEIIVDEAHSGGIYGPQGEGKCVELGIQHEIFARIVTFGKAWGNAGAVVLGSQILKEFLINFARTFIYSTAPNPLHINSLSTTLKHLKSLDVARKQLFDNISFFRNNKTSPDWGESQSAIQTFFVKGNLEVRNKAKIAQEMGFAIKPIVYPTVAKGKERIRITLSALSQKKDMLNLIEILENNE
ncbi:aminotransferase class I/II-fold pyridoxal phosphate-dependent enzyme [Aquirufa sp. ROCK-SH2]